MRGKLIALVALGALAATSASAQVLDLSGPFQCIQGCGGAGRLRDPPMKTGAKRTTALAARLRHDHDGANSDSP
jgi:hypothetical protein